ncbi:hypothetical protein Nepgr_032985 [Nepenthes gracilis]|uniref:Uncharacterized protein n=1 Tax=Nepenthes gracilis TaxID=150966 RepID=A0AAD3TLW8_NEPGR|nr:hypothetical protein Nepgr_032985 [Nepenthes gracilis]
MAAGDSYGNSWADQWDLNNNADHTDHQHKEDKSFTKKYSQKFGEGLNKTKDAASAGMDKTKTAATKGMKKVKEGASVGLYWIKEKYRKTTHKFDFVSVW